MTRVFWSVSWAFLLITFCSLQKTYGHELPETPDYLYHWISSRVFIELSPYEEAIGIDTRPKRISYPTPSGDARFFKDIGEYGGDPHRLTTVAYNFPELKGRHGIFTTTNPVTGSVGTIRDERYGEVLVRFKLNHSRVQRANIKRQSMFGDQGEPLSQAAKKANLLFHVGMNEWIILDPSIIESFTADPEILREELEMHLRKLKLSKDDPNYEYSKQDMHGLDFNEVPADSNAYFQKVTDNLRNYAIYAISKFLKYGRILIPRYSAGQADARVPWPEPEKRKKLQRQLKAEEEAIQKREAFLDSQVAVRESDQFDHKLLQRIVGALKYDIERQLKKEFKIKESDVYHRFEHFFFQLDTAVFSPVMNAYSHKTRFSGRFFEWSWKGDDSKRREPYEKLSGQEVLEINHTLAKIRNGNLSVDEMLNEVARLFEAEEAIGKEVKRVLKEHNMKNLFRIKRARVKFCRQLF